MAKLPKAKAGYQDPGHHLSLDHCNLCRYWLYDRGLTGKCQLVAGPIQPHGTCKLWELDAPPHTGFQLPNFFGR